MFKKYALAVFAAPMALLFAAPQSATAAETTLTSVTSLQQTNTLTKSYLANFVKQLNQQGSGVVKIKYLGGQDVVPPRKAAKALKRGQFDMLWSPVSYYLGMVPEGYGLLAANLSPQEVRKNGGWKILEEIFAKKAGAKVIAWGESSTQYNTYLMFKPRFDKDGVPDLSGVKMRATGTYRPLFKALGASTINTKSSEIYTSLQRGVVQGFGWPDVAIVPLGLHKIVKYRVMPAFYHANTVVTMNMDKWNSLSGAAKKLIKKVALEYERRSINFMEIQRKKEEKILHDAGVKDIKLTGKAAAKYLRIAHGEIWKALAKRSPDYTDKLRGKFYTE
jgi:TRAP-type C4-dicarboxylate transport system substrate-binding protein